MQCVKVIWFIVMTEVIINTSIYFGLKCVTAHNEVSYIFAAKVLLQFLAQLLTYN
jgi:hypothetical protein